MTIVNASITSSRFSRSGVYDGYSSKLCQFTVSSDSHPGTASGELSIWRNNGRWGISDHDEFAIVTDEDSAAESDIGPLVETGWAETDYHPLDFGDIIHFRRLRISNASADVSSCIWVKINEILTHKFRPTSLILLKAFPLEFEGKLGDDDPDARVRQALFERRRAAMKRHYRRVLGMQEVGGCYADDGWMFKLVRCPVEPMWKRADLSCLTTHEDVGLPSHGASA